MSDDLPPWEPIADWLIRISDTDASKTLSRKSHREKHEETAKAIAYDIATHEDTQSQAVTPNQSHLTGGTAPSVTEMMGDE